ncbi:MAG TPA: substrate-binding domain-containing protein [Gaiellaceae bacterium]|nr:substrate-binding domain-containing protein [Gaiellaceae bacterium]
MTDRAGFLRQAGAGAAGLSLAQLLGPEWARADGGGGDFPRHPRWRFVFCSHDTLDPLFVATQFGAQDAAALVGCSMQWTGSAKGSAEETARAVRSAVSRKADGIVVSIPDEHVLTPAVDTVRRARIPLVAFNVGPVAGRTPYVGENPYASGARAGAEITRLVPGGEVTVFAPAERHPWTERRLEGVLGALARAKNAPSAAPVRLAGDVRQRQRKVESTLAARPAARGAIAVDGLGTLALGRALQKRGGGAVRGGGYDLLPADMQLVADGVLEFVVDQQPYVQGFAPVIQLFLARISQGTVLPWDTETSVLLRRADVQAFIRTKSRFEGSSSRHEYPLRRG